MMPGPSKPVLKLNEGRTAAPPTSGEVVWRSLVTILALLNPVTAILALLITPLLTWSRRLRGWWMLSGAALVAVIVVLAGGGRSYVAPYRALADAITRSVRGRRIADVGATVGRLASDRWQDWIIGQLPFAIALALLIGASVAAYRRRYAPTWRATPRQASKRAARHAVKRLPLWPQKSKSVRSLADLNVLLGVDRLTAKPFSLPALAFGKHAYIDGPSGFGKTTDLITIMRGLIEAPAAQPFRIGLVYINMKPDPEITDAVARLAAAAGRRLHIVTEDGNGATTTYNPIRHGTAQQARNILIEAEANGADGGFSEAHYRRSGERFALICLEVLDALAARNAVYRGWSGKRETWTRDLHHLARLMDVKKLNDYVESVPSELSVRLASYLEELKVDRDLAKGGSGLRQRFASAVEGAAGAVMHEEPDGLDLREAITAGDVVLFNLDAARDAQAARQLGNLALQDYTAALGELGARRWHKAAARGRRGGPEQQNRLSLCVVDEFSALGGSLLQSLFERSRSNGGGVILATQVSAALGEASLAFKDSVIKNSNVKVLHQQDTNAEEYAQLIGTEKTVAETTQVFDDVDLFGQTSRASGQGSLRQVDQFRVHPNELRDLEPGQAIVFTKTPAQQHRVLMRFMTAPPVELAESSTPAEPAAGADPQRATDVAADPTAETTPAAASTRLVDDQPDPDRTAAIAWATAAETAAVPAPSTPPPASDSHGLDEDYFGPLDSDAPPTQPPPEDD